MSESAFVGPFARRKRRARTIPTGRTEPASAHIPDAHGPETHGAEDRHRSSRWLGSEGDQLRLRVRVEHVHRSTAPTRTFLARVEATGDLVEWTMPRRHHVTIGERLALSGIVKAHTTRHDVPVTLLRDCFNPLRMT